MLRGVYRHPMEVVAVLAEWAAPVHEVDAECSRPAVRASGLPAQPDARLSGGRTSKQIENQGSNRAGVKRLGGHRDGPSHPESFAGLHRYL